MTSLQGQFLIASPRLGDANFSRTVTLVVQHGDEGALGLVLNHPSETTVREGWEQVSETACPFEGVIYRGGPCPGPLMALHTREEASQVEVAPGVHFCVEPDKLEQLAWNADGPMRFFAGYAGWSPGQLDAEMELKSWLTFPATKAIVFGDSAKLWATLMRQKFRALGLPLLNPETLPLDPRVN